MGYERQMLALRILKDGLMVFKAIRINTDFPTPQVYVKIIDIFIAYYFASRLI